jgi:hypothetical protein
MTLTEAYLRASDHRGEIEAGRLAGCFYCLEIFPAGHVADWIDGGRTAVCPRCGVDSVLSDKFGAPLKRPFLEKMQARWFPEAMAGA